MHWSFSLRDALRVFARGLRVTNYILDITDRICRIIGIQLKLRGTCAYEANRYSRSILKRAACRWTTS